jgi:multisubunit Na+/H+ antiporter MnhB subunit
LIGFAVEALQYSRYLLYYPGNAAAYVAGDVTTKAAIAASHSTIGLDPSGLLVYGGVGLWFLVINLLALREKTWPQILAYAGVIGGIAYWLVVLGLFTEIELFVTIAAATAVIIGPIWYIWMGLDLRRSTV